MPLALPGDAAAESQARQQQGAAINGFYVQATRDIFFLFLNRAVTPVEPRLAGEEWQNRDPPDPLKALAGRERQFAKAAQRCAITITEEVFGVAMERKDQSGE